MRSTHWHSRLNLDYRLKTKFRRKINTLVKKNPSLSPYSVTTKILAGNWWGKAWNAHLKNYTPKKIHLEKGKLHFRCEALADLKIQNTQVDALVLGSKIQPYEITLTFEPITQAKWNRIQKLYDGHLESFEKIIDHQFPKDMSDVFSNKPTGLFPSQKEVSYNCSCSDRTSLCKHVATVLYALGSKIDSDGQILFQLRGVDIYELISKSIHTERTNILKRVNNKKLKTLNNKNLSDLFGIQIQTKK